ncbi:hypothetical protein [Phaeocystidibacter marisrubri]|uniref:Uncharacterized protein n=1 Tax=Phaeocystidibacter marisrubri TaxID=1577780 RepID=A0A6L3ZFP3_9FLAO|nr:hypothetical protein [Phaeocystidibacter marisrubri]KAB2816486.1 hypothetical protein F8C82_12455 [Phaeocystidibacter marisrubri]
MGVGLFYLFRAAKWREIERWIAVIIWINIGVDLAGNTLSKFDIESQQIYNVTTVLEQVLTLWVYWIYSRYSAMKKVLIALVFTLPILALAQSAFRSFQPVFNMETFVLSGIIVAVCSYFVLRNEVLNQQQHNKLIFFAMANLLYYTLMVSSMSALPLAYSISKDFGVKIKYLNDGAYALWSITLLIGLLWHPKKTT